MNHRKIFVQTLYYREMCMISFPPPLGQWGLFFNLKKHSCIIKLSNRNKEPIMCTFHSFIDIIIQMLEPTVISC